MPDFLADIVARVVEDVHREEYAAGLPLPSLEPRASLRTAIVEGRPNGSVVVEYKRISPGSPNPVLPGRSLDDFVRATERGGVAGYSCVATRPRFDGSPKDVAELAAITKKPILFKDFVVGTRQLDVAVATGSSAVLLIQRLERTGLLEASIPDLTRAAHERGLEVLLELYDPAEVPAAREVPADLYGVNARDLETLTVDRHHAERTLEAAWEGGLTPLLGLSGIERPVDARGYLDSGADGVLVGTAAARSPDPAAFLRSLLADPKEGRR